MEQGSRAVRDPRGQADRCDEWDEVAVVGAVTASRTFSIDRSARAYRSPRRTDGIDVQTVRGLVGEHGSTLPLGSDFE